jgi:tRNA U34 5-methylaminomethyl-2-thiouridine-forming methyltransferase MnmC
MSLRSLLHGETFHPVVGPMAEARELHAGQSRLIERAEKTDRLVVWDVGLGAAANAVAVLESLADAKCRVELHSFDHSLAPLDFAVKNADALGYLVPWRNAAAALVDEGRVHAGAVEWFFHPGDFRTQVASPPAPAPHAVLYDPYSPAANPGMWSLEHFTRLRAVLTEPCTLTSYSRSTAVRVTLALAGFHVGQGTATGEKDQTTVAATRRDLLAAPLGREWLGRVRRSTRAAPLRGNAGPGPISDADFAVLAAQFGDGGAPE